MQNLKLNNNPFKWTNILLKLGYSGIVDHGDGIIHSNEPNQCVAFGSKFIDIIKVEDNENSKIDYKKEDQDQLLKDNLVKKPREIIAKIIDIILLKNDYNNNKKIIKFIENISEILPSLNISSKSLFKLIEILNNVDEQLKFKAFDQMLFILPFRKDIISKIFEDKNYSDYFFRGSSDPKSFFNKSSPKSFYIPSYILEIALSKNKDNLNPNDIMLLLKRNVNLEFTDTLIKVCKDILDKYNFFNNEDNVRNFNDIINGYPNYEYKEYIKQASSDDIFIHYTDSPDLYGINPKTTFNTPAGFYGYIEKEEKSIFATSRKYIIYFKIKGNILDLQQYSESDLRLDVFKLINIYNDILGDFEEAKEAITNLYKESETKAIKNTPGARIWYITYLLSNT